MMRLKLVVPKDAYDETKEMIEITDILLTDLSRVVEIADKAIKRANESAEYRFQNEQETWNRLTIRLLITLVEATCFKLKRLVLIRHNTRNHQLDEKDTMKMTEKRSDGGLYFMSTADNLKCSFNMYAAAFNSKYKIKYGKEWGTFLRIQKIRKGLTHPKKKSDLSVSSSEYKAAYETAVWFTKILGELIDSTPRL